MLDNQALLRGADCGYNQPSFRPPGKRAIHPRLVGLRSVTVTSFVMLMLSAAIWGAVYLLNSGVLR